jgi:hypothetical protein
MLKTNFYTLKKMESILIKVSEIASAAGGAV